MKQVIQSYKTGELQLAAVPTPTQARRGQLLVATRASLVSVGTEKAMIDVAQKSLLGKALARPDWVKQVVDKVRAEGLLEAYRQSMARLEVPMPMGYSSAGVVMDVGDGVTDFSIGDRVACAGSGYASHAEIVSVPRNLVVKIPLCPPAPPTLGGTERGSRTPPRIGGPGGQGTGGRGGPGGQGTGGREGPGGQGTGGRGGPGERAEITFEEAAFVALGGIALEAVRMARLSLGETAVVIGLGLLGQIAIQLLNAAGCHVIGMDINAQKAEMALQHGAGAVAADYAQLSILNSQFSGGAGCDAVIILAATPSNEPLEQAAELCRERGRIVAAGLVGLEISRKPFYDKELELVVSRAWGPGLYDPTYAEKGLDYPIAYARWTAKRNMEEFLAQLAKGTVRVDHLITHRFPFDRALEAYELILEGKEPYIGVLLEYGRWKGEDGKGRTENGKGKRVGEGEVGSVDPLRPPTDRVVWIRQPAVAEDRQPKESPISNLQSPISVGLIGAGQFANGTLLPAMKGLKGLRYRGVATATGLSARHTADKFGFDYCTTDYRELLNDPESALVFILTRHGSHAHFITEALKAGKHVFVEKPLALSIEQLRSVYPVCSQLAIRNSQLLMVGFNRRFSPFTQWLKSRFANTAEPLAVHCTVNAGPVPPDHWVHDPEQGGGRVIGEVCHFVDLIQYLTDSVPVRVYAETLASDSHRPSDNVVIILKMANGAVGSITYVAGGDKRHPRERVEVFGGGAVGVIENFKAAAFTRGGRKQRTRNWLSVDRGHRGEIEALIEAIRNGDPAPVAFEEYVYTTLATFAIEESLRQREPALVDLEILQGTNGPATSQTEAE